MVAGSIVSSLATSSWNRGLPCGVFSLAYASILVRSAARSLSTCTTARPSRTVTTSVPVVLSLSCLLILLSSRPGPIAVTSAPDVPGRARSRAIDSSRSTAVTRSLRTAACCWRSRSGTVPEEPPPWVLQKASGRTILRPKRGRPFWINSRVTFYGQPSMRPGNRQCGQVFKKLKRTRPSG